MPCANPLKRLLRLTPKSAIHNGESSALLLNRRFSGFKSVQARQQRCQAYSLADQVACTYLGERSLGRGGT